MNYREYINHYIETVKADKNLSQPGRNRAVSHAFDSLACVLYAETTIAASSKNNALESIVNASEQNLTTLCTCPYPDVTDTNCPVHGDKT